MNTIIKLALIILSFCFIGRCLASEKLKMLEDSMVDKWGACSPFGAPLEEEVGRWELCKLIELNYSYVTNSPGSKKLFSKYFQKHKDKPHTYNYLVALRDYKMSIDKWYLQRKKEDNPEVKERI